MNSPLMNNLEKNEVDLLLTVLERAIDTENNIRNTTRTTMNFYSTLLLSLIGSILIVAKDMKETILGITFLIGGICLFLIPIMAYKHYKSDYRRQIETVTVQAKIEDVLGLTDVKKYNTRYWNHEPIIPTLYVKTREKFTNSQEFVNSFVNGTDMNFIFIYYGIFCLVGVFFISFGVYKLMGY